MTTIGCVRRLFTLRSVFAALLVSMPAVESASAEAMRSHAAPGSVSATATAASSQMQIPVSVLPGGGQSGGSASFLLSGNTGQTAIGTGQSGNYLLLQGFWPASAIKFGCCDGITGNVDEDPGDMTDCSDLQALVDYILMNHGTIQGCFEEDDVTADGSIDGSDLQQLVDYIFFNFPAVSCP